MMTRFIQYGIDLGTTNSCIAQGNGADVRVFSNNDQMNVTPSVVHLLRSGRVIVGRRAISARVQDPDNVASEFKRWMGQKDLVRFPGSGKALSAEELSAEVLKSLLDDVRRQAGGEIESAVITVPAAFGTLQCEATARAARLAGLKSAPLLQEPIAAAIAYGARPDSKDQRWLLFDLGGGTLDIAIVSTRGGRLNVMEHRGNNLLGGKDIDRRIVDSIFLPAITSQYSLTEQCDDQESYGRLIRRLALKAEETKIDLSTSDSVTVSLFDLGDDLRGEPIEAEFIVTRQQMEREMGPFVDQCLKLAKEALAGARISGADLDRVLLVGGPTQIPLLRQALAAELNARIDTSLDPMTVVARGAALYASSLEVEKTAPSVAVVSTRPVARLAFDPVCSLLKAPVAGKLEGQGVSQVKELLIESQDGLWTSGWFPLGGGGLFEIDVRLSEGKTTQFVLRARDGQGRAVPLEDATFAIRQGLQILAPPLPHSIGIEVINSEGKSSIDPIFLRSSPLPAEKVTKYRADRTFRPSEAGNFLPIKLWEGEVFEDPKANTWIGAMMISSEELRRPIPAGTEIELTIKIDSSRLLSVQAYVPYLEQYFTSHEIFVPKREERDYVDLLGTLSFDLDEHVTRLDAIESAWDLRRDGSPREVLERIRRDIEDLDIELAKVDRTKGRADPDAAKRLIEAAKEIRGRLSRCEQSGGSGFIQELRIEKARETASRMRRVVSQYGTGLEQKEAEYLNKEFERAVELCDERSVLKTAKTMDHLFCRVLVRQDWYWKDAFKDLKRTGWNFNDRNESANLFNAGDIALRDNDITELEETVRKLWNLIPPSTVSEDHDTALKSGVRIY